MVYPTDRAFRWLPHLMVGLWCLLVGVAVWQHAQRSTQPPIHDAQTYFQKAQNFWHAVNEHGWAKPMDLEPSFRPPGTILMSYPFGFDLDYRGFYFRSIFWPVLLLALAAYIAAWSRRMGEHGTRNLAFAAVFLTTLPCIYQFELTADSLVTGHFGLVDNFLMGLAAVAAAASLRSVQARSLAWAAAAASIASLCLTVKPSGAYVMALVGMSWLLLAVAQVRSAPDPARDRGAPPTWAWVVKGLGLFAVLYLTTLGASLSSKYLSAQNLAFGAGAIAIMQSDWTLAPGVLQALIRASIGFALPALALLILMLAYAGRAKAPCPTPVHAMSKSVLALAAAAALVFGIWFWFFGSGGLFAARYFVPFAAMAAVYGLPLALDTMERLPRWQTGCVHILCALPALNLALLLAQSDPPQAWQKWTGVNLTSGAPDPVMDQARFFLGHVAAGRSSVSLYAMPLGLTDSTFQAFADYHRATDPDAPPITIRRPIDWIRSSTYRLTEILGSDYLLLEPVNDERTRARILAKSSIDSFEDERLLLQAWATGLSPDEGVRVISATARAKLLQIEDKARLEASLSLLEARHRWRDAFRAANPRRWWNERDLAQELAAHPAALSDVGFGEHFRVRAVSLNSTETDITVTLWWERRDAGAGDDWFFFVHALADDGNVLLNHQIGLIYWKAGRPEESIRFDTLTFRKPPYRSVAGIAVGVFRASDGHILEADRGNRDWNNKRVLLPVR